MIDQPTPETLAEGLYADIRQYIEHATERLEAGELVALGDLNTQVEELCARMTDLRSDAVQHFLPRLEELRIALDSLQAHMLEAREKVADEIAATTQRQKASRAYRTPEDKK